MGTLGCPVHTNSENKVGSEDPGRSSDGRNRGKELLRTDKTLGPPFPGQAYRQVGVDTPTNRLSEHWGLGLCPQEVTKEANKRAKKRGLGWKNHEFRWACWVSQG